MSLLKEIRGRGAILGIELTLSIHNLLGFAKVFTSILSLFLTKVDAVLVPIFQIRKLKHEGQNQHEDTDFSDSTFGEVLRSWQN